MTLRLTRMGTLATLLLAASIASSCSSCAEPPGSSQTNNTPANNTTPANSTTPANNMNVCRDLDGDGAKFGPNCAEATDCDDQDGNVNPSAAEVCGDGRDNNCNGVVDEECPCQTGELRLCSSSGDPTALDSSMRCKPGIQRCQKGAWSTECEGEVGPAEETCNNLDDDCDGTIDEDLRTPLGLCKDDLPPDYMPPPEDCGPTAEGDGLDNDGDGDIDEGCSCALPDGAPDSAGNRIGQPCYGGAPSTLGVGECKGGTRDCVGGTWGSCTDQVTPVPEVCGDGLDNNCNGLVDDGCPSCTPSGDEVCDGIDNNCNGIIDEGVRNACGGCGMAEAQETCGDGFDNDCNGLVDEGCPCSAAQQECYSGPQEAAGKGICAMGTQSCSGEEFGTCEGSILPQIEQCGPDGTGNGLDDDCDGEVDEGCGCTEGATRPCGTSAGVCEYGMETCSAGVWGACAGGTPATESPESSCDGLDNDCDGLTDEGLLNACGKCNEACYTQGIDPVTIGMSDEGVDTIPADDPSNPENRPGLSLSKNTFIPPFLWAANHDFDTVSKFNTDMAVEEGRYWVGDNPSRTAVDLDGNMWVGGRNDGRLTKILWDTTQCPDRNGNGVIDTSTNMGAGPVRINSAADPLADECIVYSEVPNAARPSIRGIAAAPDGKIWIGYSGGGVQSIDTATFALGTFYPDDQVPLYAPDATGKQVLQTDANGNPQTGSTSGIYGLVVDARGNLYVSTYLRTGIARFNTNTEQWEALLTGHDCGSYGIATDAEGRIWTGGWPGCPGIGMYDPDDEKFYYFKVPRNTPGTPGTTFGVDMGAEPGFLCNTADTAALYCVTGLAAEPATGDIWASFYRRGMTGRLEVNEQDYSQSQWTLIGSTTDDNGNLLPGVSNGDLRGVGFDRHGYGWTLGLSSGKVWKIDPATNRRDVSLPDGATIGEGSHYTYSDFTGSTALSFTAPRGLWRYTFDTHFPNALAEAIIIEAHAPVGTAIEVRARPLDSSGNAGNWTPAMGYYTYPNGQPSHTIDLTAMGAQLSGSAFELEVRLSTSDPDVRPILYDIRVGWQRP